MANSDSRPFVRLPGEGQEIGNAAERLGKLLAAELTHFLMDGVVVRLMIGANGRPRITPVKAVELASDFEEVAIFQKASAKPDSFSHCTEAAASLMQHSARFKEALPKLNRITPCPILVERDGELTVICGYDERSGVYACGTAPLDVPLGDAVAHLQSILADFVFATSGDRSRALAAIITPAFVAGDLLGDRAPIDLGEADKSQAGKGYRNKITTAIYNSMPVAVSQRRGVGNVDDSFAQAAMNGSLFIVLDNIRGKMDSQALESFMTEDEVVLRAAYRPETSFAPRHVVVMMTSNKAEMTEDLANRTNGVALRKQAEGYEYSEFAEGDLLKHIRANQPLYLGAVFSVIREWHRRGKLRTKESRHDFRQWCQILDWIVQELFHGAPLMDGHQQFQKRAASPNFNWMRDVALAVVAEHRTDERLLASDLLDVMIARGVAIPGNVDPDNLDDAGRTKALQQIGRRLGAAFRDEAQLKIEGCAFTREEFVDGRIRDRLAYVVATDRIIPAGQPAMLSFDDDPWKDSSPDHSADRPLKRPLTKPLVSTNPPDVFALLGGEIMEGNAPGEFKLADISGISGEQGDQREEFNL